MNDEHLTPGQRTALAKVIGHLSVTATIEYNPFADRERGFALALIDAFPEIAHLRDFFPERVSA